MPFPPEHPLSAWNSGSCTEVYKKLGAHPSDTGTTFRVWAPNAADVQLVGDFNDWQPGADAMQKDPQTGIWKAAVAEAEARQRYKYHITDTSGSSFLKADPYGFYHEAGTHRASVIWPLPEYNWKDEDWLNHRQQTHHPDQPISIYEVHAGSWKRKPSDELFSYRELADELIPYVKKMGFTHIELMPVMEHPYDPSWGYQVTGYFAPTNRYGTPDDFMAFVDACHQNGIGVILDWVPGHFPKDEHALAWFDGTALYEHEDARRREHAHWGTHNFDYEKPGVRNFLLSNAFFWCEQYHIDGFRVDAVASMLYLDYGKEESDWLPNEYGGNENLGAITFLQDLNTLIQERYPSVLTIAEESTAWSGVSRKVADGGLGFDYKWNMGWMNDTLNYFTKTPEERKKESHYITFPITFAFSERFMLPFSHDEVVHLKKSLWSKMPGSEPEKFAQLKLLYLYLMSYPGKKVLFMGGELAERREWSESRPLDWELLESDQNKKNQRFLQSLLRLYHSEPGLHRTDHSPEAFSWVDLSRKEDGLYAFSREDAESGQKFIFIFNFSDAAYNDYQIGDFAYDSLELVLNTHDENISAAKPGDFSSPLPIKPFQGVALQAKR